MRSGNPTVARVRVLRPSQQRGPAGCQGRARQCEKNRAAQFNLGTTSPLVGRLGPARSPGPRTCAWVRPPRSGAAGGRFARRARPDSPRPRDLAAGFMIQMLRSPSISVCGFTDVILFSRAWHCEKWFLELEMKASPLQSKIQRALRGREAARGKRGASASPHPGPCAVKLHQPALLGSALFVS